MTAREPSSYIDSLNDNRRLIIQGELIQNPASHPALLPSVKAVTSYYQFQQEHADQMICPIRQLPWSYLIPTSKADLQSRSKAFEAWATASYGMMGRSPDYMNSIIAASASAHSHWFPDCPSSQQALIDFYHKIAAKDCCWSHACINWSDRKWATAGANPSALHVTRRCSEGIYVSGWRSVATLSPISEWLFCFQPGPGQLVQGDEEVALSFFTPLSAKGITLVARTLASEQKDRNWPVDELDSMILFQECFIPHNQILIDGSCDRFNKQPSLMAFEAFAGQQVLMRRLVRTRFLFGLAHLLADSQQSNRSIHVNEKLGEFALYIKTLESLAIAAVEGAIWREDLQAMIPFPPAIESAMRLFADFYDKMKLHLMTLGASRFVSMPDEASIEWLETHLEPYTALTHKPWQGELYRVAWQQMASSWSARENVYEHCFFGERQLLRSQLYLETDKSSAAKLVLNYLQDLVR